MDIGLREIILLIPIHRLILHLDPGAQLLKGLLDKEEKDL
jgi:hypothetical protein